MENTGFEEIDISRLDTMKPRPERNFKADGTKDKCSGKACWIGGYGKQIFLMAFVLALSISCILAGLYYIQSSKKEIKMELRTALDELKQSIKQRTDKQSMGSTVGSVSEAPPASNNKELASEITSSPTIKTSIDSRKPWLNMRLPSYIIPSTYDISLDVNMDKDMYKGEVIIDVSVTRQTNVILLHKVGLIINSIVITDIKTSSEVAIKNRFAYAPNEFYVIQTKTLLNAGEKYKLSIVFAGEMRTDLSGFYTSFYRSGAKKNKVASTFFSPISARTAFPCFDEPIFKANFTLSLSHSDKFNARSNMPAASTCRKDGIVNTRFQPTLKMSTYILCWMISDFNSIQENGNGKVINAWTYSDNVEDIRFGLENSKKLLNFYEEYFNIPYPLKKLDIVSVPSFGPGAMENWGIITFRAERILINKKTATQGDRQKSFDIIAHELVHQWFGNLVTMEFWTDAWLKEGFANNIGAIGGHHVDKTMGSKEQVLSNFMLPALDLDSYSTSHPISTQVKTPSDIRGVFDVITYNKGSCLVDLLHIYVGGENFQKGLQRYLRTYAYGNANQDDLWKEFSIVSGKNVKAVMDTWTLQLGYPVVSVRRINDTYVEIKQQRFSLDHPSTVAPKSPFGYLWKVPIIFKSLSSTHTTMYLLEDKAAVINVPLDYSILNPDHSLFYRVHYEESMLHAIETTLSNEPSLLTAQDRTGIISDQFSFVAAKMTDIGRTLDLLSFLRHETDYFPWVAAMDQLDYIRSLITSEDMSMKFNSFVQNITVNIVRNVSWHKTKTVNEGSLQVLLLREACRSGSDTSDVVKQAEQHYMKWVTGGDVNLRPSLHPVFRDCAISHGPDYYWDMAYYMYKRGGAGSDSILWSLAATSKLATIKKMLNYSLDENLIDSQYTVYVIAQLAYGGDYKARTLCWNFVKDNWDVLMKRYGKDIFMLSDMLSSVLDGFSTEEELSDIQSFFTNRDAGSGKNAVRQAIDKIKANILWKSNNYEDLKQWLQNKGF